jgi:hypothetical protein
MLVEQSKYRAGDIINLKLMSGDEIVGELVSTPTANYELRKPCIVVTSPDGIGLLQAMFGLDPDQENLTYRDQHVITVCRTHERMREHYVTVTTAE